jgi:hypothetical protein
MKPRGVINNVGAYRGRRPFLLATTASAIDNDIKALVVTAPDAVSGSIVRFWPKAAADQLDL